MRAALVLATSLSTLLLVAAPADAQRRQQRGEAELAKALAGRTAGRPINCIRLSAIRSSRIVGGTAIIYEAGRTVYVNRPRSGTSSLDPDAIPVTRTTGSQLCNLDTVRLIDRTARIPGGFVTLGRFVPYTRSRASH